jgi:predicted enzyme related to lactoylglutathione lyase
MILRKDQAAGRHLQDDAETGDLPSSWDVYCASSDLDASVQDLMSAGVEVLRDPLDNPGAGRMAVMQDPQGAMFEVIRMASSWSTAMARNG